MKTIGLIGGMSWESTATYYRLLNEGVREHCGGLHSAKLLMYSVNFAEVALMQKQGRWDEAAELLGAAARRLESAGADLLLICTNTMHKVAPQVENAVAIPLVHIADPTGERLVADGIQVVGLLGTSFTMEQQFYRNRLTERYSLRVLIPGEEDRNRVHQVIFDELCQSIIVDSSRSHFVRIVQELKGQGCEAVILGCTEIGLLLNDPGQVGLPLYDTTWLHCQAAVKSMLLSGCD